MNMKLYIGGEDEKYIYRLAEYTESRESFETAAFSNVKDFTDRLSDFKKDQDSEDEIYLLEKSFYDGAPGSKAGELPFGKNTFCLTEEREKDGIEEDGLKYIYKYKSASLIIGSVKKISGIIPASGYEDITAKSIFKEDKAGNREINIEAPEFYPKMEKRKEVPESYPKMEKRKEPPEYYPKRERGMFRETKNCGLICVYSPIGRCLKTTFCLTLAGLLCETGRVLYINMEGYSGMSKMLGIRRNQNLSDLIYDHALDPGSVLNKKDSYITDWHGIEVIMPSSEEELSETEAESWIEILTFLAGCREFDHIIIDPSDCIRGITDIFGICSVVFMPVRRDRISALKLEEFETGLRKKGQQAELKRIRKLSFPFFKGIAEDNKTFGKPDEAFCEYIRKEGLLSLI